jgi:transcriptional regulator with XRE-family HTH domain
MGGMDKLDYEVARMLRRFRRKRGITQTALGEFWNVGFQQVQKYENGHNRLPAGKLIALLKAYYVSLEEFLGERPPDEWDQFVERPAQAPLPITLDDVRRGFQERKLEAVNGEGGQG